MDIFFEPHRQILTALQQFDVRFILIGGYAVNFHGYNRTTGDMDLWLQPVEENKEKLLAMLQQLGFDKESMEYVQSLNFSDPQTFSMGEPPAQIDFMTRITGVEFDEADKEKILADVDGIKLPVLQLNHLVRSKISNNRTKDKLDVEELQKIIAQRKKD